MAFLVYIVIYASFFCSLLQTFLPAIVTYKGFALILAIVMAVYIAYQLVRRKGIIPKTFLASALFYIFVLVGYSFITPLLYHSMPQSMYQSQQLALAGQIFPGTLFLILFTDNENIQKRMKTLAPVIGLIFSVMAFIAVTNPTSATTGGLAENQNGLNYQTIAYLAAYSSAMIFYYLVTQYDNQQIFLFNGVKGLIIALFLLIINFATILLSGGRGGLVTYLAIGLFSIILIIRYNSNSFKAQIKWTLVLFLTILGLCIGVKYVSNSSLATSGYARILSFINGGGDTNRAILRREALKSFNTRPIIGHGFGSVFWELPLYSHNFFTDVMVETGLLGLLFFSILLILTGINAVRLVMLDRSNYIWIYIFACGFALSMFSGYYLTNISLWLALAFINARYYYVRNHFAEGIVEYY